MAKGDCDADNDGNRAGNGNGSNNPLRIDAALLAIDHSFIVDNYDCGNGLGDLKVTGAIAQRYRGAVGTSGGTGFIKDYLYDDRLKYRSPPHFLSPIDSAWSTSSTVSPGRSKPSRAMSLPARISPRSVAISLTMRA